MAVDNHKWTILVCPACDAARLGPLPAWGSWCDGACSHPVTEMEQVRVIPDPVVGYSVTLDGRVFEVPPESVRVIYRHEGADDAR